MSDGSPRRGGRVLAIVLIVLVAVGVVAFTSYNGLVSRKEKVAAAWSEIDNQYKRRNDLVPNLVATVQGAADFEKSTLTAVTDARASVGRAQLPKDVPTDEKQLTAYIHAQQGLSSALGRLFSVAENYPDLKASAGFRDLQVQLEGTENRINVSRQEYIRAVQDYNTTIKRFPANLFSGLFGFDPLPQFKAEEKNLEVPVVDFSDK